MGWQMGTPWKHQKDDVRQIDESEEGTRSVSHAPLPINPRVCNFG
jgi:hypothetical protein